VWRTDVRVAIPSRRNLYPVLYSTPVRRGQILSNAIQRHARDSEQNTRISECFRVTFRPRTHSQARCRGFDPRLPLHAILRMRRGPLWSASALPDRYTCGQRKRPRAAQSMQPHVEADPHVLDEEPSRATAGVVASQPRRLFDQLRCAAANRLHRSGVIPKTEIAPTVMCPEVERDLRRDDLFRGGDIGKRRHSGGRRRARTAAR